MLFLHTADYPILDYKKSIEVPTYGKAMLTGKPRGLWFGPGFEWIERMQKYGHWNWVGSIADPGKATHTLNYYESVFGPKPIPNAEPNAELRPNWDKGRVHFVYNLPIRPDQLTDDVHAPALDKVLIFSETNREEILKLYNSYLDNERSKELSQYKPEVLVPEFYRERLEGLHHLEDTYRRLVAEGKPGTPFYQELHEDYERSLTYLCATNVLTAAMKKRCPGKPEYTTKTVPFSEKSTVELTKAALRGDLPLIGVYRNIRNIIWGRFYRDMESKWGGILFDKSLFQDKYNEELPFLKWLEAPSGCLWHPEILFAGQTPELNAILTWGTRDSIPVLEKKVLDLVKYKYVGKLRSEEPNATKRLELKNENIVLPEDMKNYYLSRLYVAGLNSTDRIKYLKRGKAFVPPSAGAGFSGGRRKTRRRPRKN